MNGTHSSKKSVLWRWIESRVWNSYGNDRQEFFFSTHICNSKCSNITNSLRCLYQRWQSLLQICAERIKYNRSRPVLEQHKRGYRLLCKCKPHLSRSICQSGEYGLLFSKQFQQQRNRDSLCSNQLTRKAVA